jgi:hypothetical protein
VLLRLSCIIDNGETKTVKKDDVETHNEGNLYSPQRPAINVKQRYWINTDKIVEKFKCSESIAEKAAEYAYDMAREGFWDQIQDTVREILHDNDLKVYSAGRSGGWLIVVGLKDIEYWDAVDLGRWAKLCRIVREDIKYICADEQILENIEANRWAEDGSERYNFFDTKEGESKCISEMKKQAKEAGFGAVIRK